MNSNSKLADWARDARSRFENRYERFPSWETGKPQPVFVQLCGQGRIGASVLDLGCGTGETALYLAEQGHQVWGLDISPTAIGIAREKARKRSVEPQRFLVGDALDLSGLTMRFDTVIDSGLLHALEDEQRTLYLSGVANVLSRGGFFHGLGFSEHEPRPGMDGPRRLTQSELLLAFDEELWEQIEVVPALFETNIHPKGASAYRFSARRGNVTL